jgi:predicted acylesterase/phospholipase RssA
MEIVSRLLAFLLAGYVLLAAGTVLWIARDIRYLYYVRVPLLTLAAVVGLPALAVSEAGESMLQNLFYGDGWDLFLIVAAAFLASALAFVTGESVLQYGPVRFSGEKPRQFPGFLRSRLGSALVAAAPVLAFYFASIKTALSSGAPVSFVWPLVGLVAAPVAFVFIYVAAGWAGQRLAGPWGRLTARILGWLPRRLAESLQAGYVDPAHPERVWSGHVRNALLASAALAGFWILNVNVRARLEAPAGGEGAPLPALVYVYVLLTFACSLLAGVAFFFDRYRIPLLAPLAVFVAWSVLRSGTDHFFAVHPAAVTLPAPAQVLEGRDRAIVVAAAGGGIQAAGWTATVLGGLAEEYAGFPGTVRLVSGVSGGSVGAMYYVAAQARALANASQPLQAKAVVDAAVAPGLDTVAWGLVSRDAWSTIGWWRSNPLIDRGWALERLLAQRAQLSGVMLSNWGRRISEGLPAVIFNAVSVRQGHPVAFATTTLPTPGRRIENFLEDRRLDLEIATAVRMSASFPFVTPVARPYLGTADTPSEHLADGGYYDNFGVAALLEWLRAAMPQAGPQVLVLRIVSFPAGERGAPPTRSWVYQTWAPLETMLSMRTAAQEIRGDVELNLMKTAWPIEEVMFQYTPPEGCSIPPLSWTLTQHEVGCLERAWRQHPSRDAVGQFLKPDDRSSGVR